MEFYKGSRKKTKKDFHVKIISKSLERLLKKGLITAVAVRTEKKWFIKEIFLTRKGKKVVKELKGRQLILKLDS